MALLKSITVLGLCFNGLLIHAEAYSKPNIDPVVDLGYARHGAQYNVGAKLKLMRPLITVLTSWNLENI